MLSFQVIMDRGPKQGADHQTKVTNHVSDGFFFVAKLEKFVLSLCSHTEISSRAKNKVTLAGLSYILSILC